MSFKQNDNNNNMIHLGNYEEYFILYMDNELSDEQVQMVDEFLAQHPDLQGEFELLMSTRLPMEELNINKDELLSGKMRLSTVDEELLLYIDNELPAQEKKVVELELKTNRDYQLQHELLMRSKLEASEKVMYPNKKELYRKEERRVVAFKPWMRVAAAVIVIAVAGVLYFTNSPAPGPDHDFVANTDGKKTEILVKDNRSQNTSKPGNTKPANIITSPGDNSNHRQIKENKQDDLANQDVPQLPKEVLDNIAKVKQQNQQITQDTEDPQVVLRDRTAIIDNKSIADVAIAKIETPSEIINKNPVTSALANRKTDVDASPKEINKDVASNKGSVKGFLRKTTRLIEKKTGIDPTNDGELLIGALAINLN
jgi:hypothetical protein